MRPTAPPNLALLLCTQSPQREVFSGPMDLMSEEEELTSLINMFNKQFYLFVRAQEAQNTISMKYYLSLASMTQERIIELVGRDDAICLCQEWIPSKELRQLDLSLAHQTNGRELQNPSEPIIQPLLQLAVAPHANYQPMIATPTPEPTGFQHQAMARVLPLPTIHVFVHSLNNHRAQRNRPPQSSNAAAATTTTTAADAPSTINTLILPRHKGTQITTPLILKTIGEDQRGIGDAHGTTLREFSR
ncbi:hypothetical protein PTTG_10231 [Puccinia triticina 1-1 BBBD Race 1]|uniref:Uncharacterized protein n=1 Tax=Puccinia triticina (isolate 1-1 / race 1 (BBBD)) TaxID=630390 RepID=A0A0C4FAI8_PUCT1|nr:hypothetical protein PTTG_10231 [Puccinia triticina 1-1 BBBD Race 1]